MHVIELDAVSFSYNHTEILHTLDLAIEDGQFFTIIGPNGAGKTTLLKIILGLLKPDTGTVRINGRDVSAMTALDRAREIAYVPQQEHVLFPFNVREVVLMGRSPYHRGLGFERARDIEIARRAMALCDIADMANRPYPKLSGGEQHRVTIARALAQQTPVLALDEPNAHLDMHHQVSLFDLLRSLNRRKKKTIICVSHDINLAATYSDRIALMHEGQLVQVGAPEEVLNNPDLISVFRTSIDITVDDGAPPRIHIVAGSTRIDESLLEDLPPEIPAGITKPGAESGKTSRLPKWIIPATIVSEVLALFATWLFRYGRQETSILDAPIWCTGNILSVLAFSLIIALVIRIGKTRISKQSYRSVFFLSLAAICILPFGLLPWHVSTFVVFTIFSILKVFETGLLVAINIVRRERHIWRMALGLSSILVVFLMAGSLTYQVMTREDPTFPENLTIDLLLVPGFTGAHPAADDGMQQRLQDAMINVLHRNDVRRVLSPVAPTTMKTILFSASPRFGNDYGAVSFIEATDDVASTLTGLVTEARLLARQHEWSTVVFFVDEFRSSRVNAIRRFQSLDAIVIPVLIHPPPWQTAFSYLRESIALLLYWFFGM